MNADIKSCVVCRGFNVAVFDHDGRQIPKLQQNALLLWVEMADRAGYNVEGLVVDTCEGKWRIVRNVAVSRWTHQAWNLVLAQD